MLDRVEFRCVRVIQVQQISMWEAEDELIGRRFPVESLLGDNHPNYFRSYTYLEIVTSGWKSGASTRVKKLVPGGALSYVNKLHSGRWIDDEQYDLMYTATDALLRKLHLGPWAWTVLPSQFSDVL